MSDKTEADMAKEEQSHTVTPEPAEAAARADAIDENNDGDGVARFDAVPPETGT